MNISLCAPSVASMSDRDEVLDFIFETYSCDVAETMAMTLTEIDIEIIKSSVGFGFWKLHKSIENLKSEIKKFFKFRR